MENDGLFGIESQNGNGTVPAAVAAAVDALAEAKDKLTETTNAVRSGDDEGLPHPKKAKLELNDNEANKSEVVVEKPAEQIVEKMVEEVKNGTEEIKPETPVTEALPVATKPAEPTVDIKPEESNGDMHVDAAVVATETPVVEAKANDIEMTTKVEKAVEEVKPLENVVKKDEINDKPVEKLLEKPAEEQNCDKKKEEENTKDMTDAKEVKENHAVQEVVKVAEECKKAATEEDVAKKANVEEAKEKTVQAEAAVEQVIAEVKETLLKEEKVIEETSAKVESAAVETSEKVENLPKQEEKPDVVDNKQTEHVVLENGGNTVTDSPAEVTPAVVEEEVKVVEKIKAAEEKPEEPVKDITEAKTVDEEPVKEKITEKIEQKEEKPVEEEPTKSAKIEETKKTEEDVTPVVVEKSSTTESTVEPVQAVEPPVVESIAKAEQKTEEPQSAEAVVEDVKVEKSEMPALAEETVAEIAATVVPVVEEPMPMPIEADSPLVAGIDIDEVPAMAAAALVEPLPATSAPTLALNDQPMEDLPMDEAAPEEVIMTESVVASGLAGLVEMTTDAMEATSKVEPPVDGMDVDDTSQEAMDQ